MTTTSDGSGVAHLRATTPTISDVAVLAGVGTMTASRALAGGKNVKPDKIERVLAAAATLGYRRNENARSIRPGQRTGLIGVIITNVSNPYYADVQLGIEESLAREDFRLLVGNSGEDLAREQRLVQDFTGRQVDGLIVVPSGTDYTHLQPLRLGHTPLVLASREVEDLDVDSVVIDDIHGAYQGTRKLLDEGHRRIAYVGHMVSTFTSRRRFEGFARAHEEHGLRVHPNLVRSDLHNPAAAEEAMHSLLDLAEPPTAVFSANNRNTVGVLRALGHQARTNPPAAPSSPFDIRVVGFDNFELSDMMPFELTVIDHDPRELGRQAGALLLDRLEDDGRPTRRIQLPTRLL